MKKIKLPTLIFSILITQGAGFVGSIFTTPSIPTWYQGLNKPSFTPPNYIFAPVWTMLYLFMGISLYMILVLKEKNKAPALRLFFIQLFLNSLWSIVFFGLRDPFSGLIVIVALWIVVLLTIIKFYKLNKNAGLLLIPYLIWISFASLLNYYIYLLN